MPSAEYLRITHSSVQARYRWYRMMHGNYALSQIACYPVYVAKYGKQNIQKTTLTEYEFIFRNTWAFSSEQEKNIGTVK
jgi:hypothetical protein